MPSTDRDALVALYNATDGTNWRKSTNWNEGADLSLWHGIEVNDQGRVVELCLPSNNLRGHVPKELGALSKLRFLVLSNNQLLTGAIPKEIGALGKLEKLMLYGNKLTGHLPKELGALSKLQILELSGNELTGEIPASLGQLSKLRKLHLDDNNLSGVIPKELGALGMLELLSLGNNNLTGVIPKELGALGMLERLSLGATKLDGTGTTNKLTGSIPKELGTLTELTVLNLCCNQLTGAIPKELGALGKLEDLQLHKNELTGPIPRELGNLGALQGLYLYNNQLSGSIPKELGGLSELVELNLSANQLTGSIPKELGTLTELTVLNLGWNQLTDIPRATAEAFRAMRERPAFTLAGNRWGTPPWRVIRGGWDQVVTFYEGLSQSGGEVVPSLKVVLVGAVRAGKTTLARGLLDGEIAQTLPPRTRGVDVHIQPWVPEFDPPLEVVIWDFAGHEDYYSTHQLFLTDGALHLLVVDLHKFDRDPLSRANAVYIWLDSLLCRVPEGAVLVVATHADVFGDDHKRSAAALEDLEAAITRHLETKKEEWLAAQRQIERERRSQARSASTERGDFKAGSFMGHSKSTPPSLRLCGFISVSGRSLDGITALGENIWEVSNEPTVFPDVRQIVPNIWRRMWAVMDALRVGADPASAVRLEGPAVAIEGRVKLEFVTEEKAFEEWSCADRESAAQLEAAGDDSEQLPQALSRQFQAALNHRQRGGSILAACGLIHLNPPWINELLRELLDHRLADPKEAEWWREQLEMYGREHGFRFNRLLETHRRFVTTGMLTKHYLQFLWREVVKGVDEVVFARLVETMAVHNAMFPCDDGVVEGDDKEFMVPARLPDSVAGACLAKLEEVVSMGTRMQFVIEIYAEYVPPAIIAQFLGGFRRSGGDVFRNLVWNTCWARGVAFEVAGKECLVRLGEAFTAPGRMIEINIAGRDKNDVCDVGFEIKNKLVQLLEEWYPGMLFDASINPTYMNGREAWQDSLDALQRDLLEKLDQNLESVLSKILETFTAQSLSVDQTLANQLSSLRSDMQRDFSFQLDSKAQEIVIRVENLVRASLSTTTVPGGGLSETDRGILKSVARNVAFLLWPIPRLMCLLPAPESGEKTLEERDRSFQEWSTVLQNWCSEGKKKGKGVATRKLRLFFLCPQDMSLAECGPDGQGYEVKELLKWAKKAKPLAKVGLTLTSIALKVCTGLAIPTTGFEDALGTTAGGALSEFVEETLTSGVEAMASVAGERLEGDRPVERLHHAGAHSVGKQKVWPTPVAGFDYDQLRKVVKSFEVNRTQKGKSPFPSFNNAMQLVDRGGSGVEWAWVRTRNIDQFVSS